MKHNVSGTARSTFVSALIAVCAIAGQQAQATLERWLQSGPSRSSGLWKEWQTILAQGQWRKALGHTRRAQALRQASPLTTVLPEDARQNILAQVRELRQGVLLGETMNKAAP